MTEPNGPLDFYLQHSCSGAPMDLRRLKEQTMCNGVVIPQGTLARVMEIAGRDDSESVCIYVRNDHDLVNFPLGFFFVPIESLAHI